MEIQKVNQLTYQGRLVNQQDLSPTTTLILSYANAVKLIDGKPDDWKTLWNDLILLTGVRYENSQRGDEQKHSDFSTLVEALLKTHRHRTFKEIIHAFELARDEKLVLVDREGNKQLTLIRLLDYACICETLKAYDRYVKEQLGDLISNQKLFADTNYISKIDREASNRSVGRFLCEAWTLALQGKIEELRGVFLYDFLIEQNLIDLTKEEKTKIVELSKERFRYDKEHEKKNVDLSMRRKITNLLENLTINEPELVLYMKRIALMQQCIKWHKNGILPEYIIGQFKFKE